MRADRNKKISIKQIVSTQDGYGQRVEEYQDVYADVWAAVEPLIGREFFEAQKTNSEVKAKIRLEYLTGINEKMIAFYGERKFEIMSVIDPKEQHNELLLMCKELV